MADINQSASASAEANLAKFSGNTVNFNQAPANIVSGPTGIAKMVRTIAPVWYEEREAKALSVRANSLTETAQRLKEQFPVMSERRAVMEALGYRMTNEQADNVCEVFSGAQEIIDSDDKSDDPIAPEMRDAIVDGSKGAYDDFIRNMWKKLITGIVKTPGSFSRRTASTLADMDPSDAKAFAKICSYAITPFVPIEGISTVADSIIVLQNGNGSSFNGGNVSHIELGICNSLGLIDNTLMKIRKFLPTSMPIPFKVGEKVAWVTNPGNAEVVVEFGGAAMLPLGEELASLCQLGTASDLPSLFEKKMSDNGLVIQWSNITRTD